MRLANVDGRATLVEDNGGADLYSASSGRFPASVDDAIAALDDVAAWRRATPLSLDPELSLPALAKRLDRLGPPVTNPSQTFAIGVNYRSHGTETGIAVSDSPMIFTKFPSSIAGPGADIPIPTETTDWEVELVAIVGRGGRHLDRSHALGALAGFCVGQDISERTSQMAGSPAQFSLAKSHRHFAPIGPWLTTLDELRDPLDLAISCRLDDESVQDSRTNLMVFDVVDLVVRLSTVCELRPGDLIFTGTPDGVGYTRQPPRYLADGIVIRSEIEGLGALTNTCVNGELNV